MSPLKAPAHVPQLAVGYCLPACAQMALAQLGLHVTQPELARLLGTRRGLGTPFSNVSHLTRWPVEVHPSEWGSVAPVEAALAAEQAVIAAVTTSPHLPGWDDLRTQHTILLVGIDAEQVTYHDPALTHGPVSVARDEFLLAWSEMAELVAILGRR